MDNGEKNLDCSISRTIHKISGIVLYLQDAFNFHQDIDLNLSNQIKESYGM